MYTRDKVQQLYLATVVINIQEKKERERERERKKKERKIKKEYLDTNR